MLMWTQNLWALILHAIPPLKPQKLTLLSPKWDSPPIEIVNSSLPSFDINWNQPVKQISASNNELTRAEFGPNISTQYNPNFSQIAPALVQNIVCQIYIKTTSSHNRIIINSLYLPSYDSKELTHFRSIIRSFESAVADTYTTNLQKYLLHEHIAEVEARDIVTFCDEDDATKALKASVAQLKVLYRDLYKQVVALSKNSIHILLLRTNSTAKRLLPCPGYKNSP